MGPTDSVNPARVCDVPRRVAIPLRIKPMTHNDFNIGDNVSLRLDPGVTFVVCMYRGKKAIKTPGILGWMHFEPLDWNDVIKN